MFSSSSCASFVASTPPSPKRPCIEYSLNAPPPSLPPLWTVLDAARKRAMEDARRDVEIARSMLTGLPASPESPRNVKRPWEALDNETTSSIATIPGVGISTTDSFLTSLFATPVHRCTHDRSKEPTKGILKAREGTQNYVLPIRDQKDDEDEEMYLNFRINAAQELRSVVESEVMADRPLGDEYRRSRIRKWQRVPTLNHSSLQWASCHRISTRHVRFDTAVRCVRFDNPLEPLNLHREYILALRKSDVSLNVKYGAAKVLGRVFPLYVYEMSVYDAPSVSPGSGGDVPEGATHEMRKFQVETDLNIYLSQMERCKRRIQEKKSQDLAKILQKWKKLTTETLAYARKYLAPAALKQVYERLGYTPPVKQSLVRPVVKQDIDAASKPSPVSQEANSRGTRSSKRIKRQREADANSSTTCKRQRLE